MGRGGCHVRLCSGGQHTDANGLGQKQHVTRPGPGVGQHLVRVDKARHRKAILWLVIQNAVPAGDERTGLVHLVVPAPQQLMHCLPGHGFRYGHDIQAQLRLAAHGIYIAEGIGGRDLAEKIGVVGNGRKKIHGLHQGQILGT